MRRAKEILVSGILLACALVTTGIVIHREFFPPTTVSHHSEQRPVFLKAWRDDLPAGVRLGAADAPVQVIEFADFECPFCAEFHNSFQPLRNRYPTRVGLTYIHYPLQGHRFAIPAARAAECAGDQGRFEAMYDQLFEHQDHIGLKPWSDFASAAGVPDLTAFEECVKSADPIPRVEDGKALGNRLEIQGTPTIIINGWKLGRPPNEKELDGMVKAILAGKSPVTEDGRFAR